MHRCCAPEAVPAAPGTSARPATAANSTAALDMRRILGVGLRESPRAPAAPAFDNGRVPTAAIIVAYRSGERLTRCVEALTERDSVDQVIVVDNGEGGSEINAVRTAGALVVSAGENLGFAGGCNLGARHADTDRFVFLNPDTVIGEGAISALAQTLDDEAIGVAMPRLRLFDRPELLNSAGCSIHISGLAWSSGFGTPAESINELREITYANGSALAIRADLFREVGGFTDEFFIYHEDLELCWKVRMRGLRVIITPEADVFHDYEYARNPTKNFYMERNRLVFISSAYSLRLISVLAPVLLVAEAGLTALSWWQGWLGDKVAAWRWCVRHRSWMRKHRRELQQQRLVSDRDLARHLTPVIDPAMIDVPAPVRAANPVLRAYWGLVRRLL
jgi:GT2 family glycosyltransferase